MKPTIRPATPHDTPQVLAMMRALAQHHGETATTSLPVLHHQIFGLGLGRILVAAEDEGLVGYALILPRPNLVTGGASHDIHHLFVVEWRRRAGIGRALIAAAAVASHAEGAEALTISAQTGNPGAQAAYRTMGLAEQPVAGVRFKVDLAAAG
jgi:GNAT superfamily N-acetyltransferase